MRFERVKFRNFRNISSLTMETGSEDIVLTGENGQGKTNFLEAIYILCYGSSFRTAHLKDAVEYGADGFFISGEFGSDIISVSFFKGERKIMLSGKEITDRKDLIYLFPCIAYTYSDFDIIKGEPENRRRFFNQMMSLCSPVFFDETRTYSSLLKSRNAAIRAEEYGTAALYDHRLAMAGFNIMNERKKTVEDFNEIFTPLYKEISKSEEDVKVEYKPSWNSDWTIGEIEEYISENIERDCALGTTSSGIHRDRFTVATEKGPMQIIGSTGQIRLCSVLFRLAEEMYFTERSGKKPILLVDDVLLELDYGKRAGVLDVLKGYSQAFYTFLPDEKYFGKERGRVYRAEGGKFHER